MSETTFLAGKVRKRTLPLFYPPVPADAEGPKRVLLPQGELANFYDHEEGIRYAALIQLQAGKIRGNHFHRIKHEQIYLISGALLLLAQDGAQGERVSVDLRPGDLVSIATGVVHALQPLEPGYAIEFCATRFDPADVERFTLI